MAGDPLTENPAGQAGVVLGRVRQPDGGIRPELENGSTPVPVRRVLWGDASTVAWLASALSREHLAEAFRGVVEDWWSEFSRSEAISDNRGVQVGRDSGCWAFALGE